MNWRTIGALCYVCVASVFGSVGVAMPFATADDGIVIREGLGQRLDDYLSRLEAFGFHGAVLVEVKGEVVLARGYGIADRSRESPITTDTVFDIGSLGKQFVAAGALLLESRGKLRVTDTVAMHIPDAPEDKRDLTVHQLMTHTAGLPYIPTRDDPFEEPLTGEPGGAWVYSNSGYAVLGRVLDTAAGEPLEDFITREIFDRLEMTNTKFKRDLRESTATMARAYTDDTDQGTAFDMPMPARLRGAGGVVSTLGDLMKWEHAIREHRLLEAPAIDRTFTEYARNASGTVGYGYGWMIRTTIRGTKLVHHGGNYGGFNCDYRRYVDEGVTILCLSNHFVSGRSMRDAALDSLSTMVNGGEIPLPPKMVARGQTHGDTPLDGVYELPGGGEIAIKDYGERLLLTADGPAAMSAVFMPDANDEERAFAAHACEQTARTITGLMQRDTEPLRENISPSLPFGPTVEMIGGQYAALIERHGDLQNCEAIGAALTSGAGGYVLARATFEHGEQLLRLTWSNRRIIHFAQVDAGPSREFAAVEDGGFAAYDIFTRREVLARVERDREGRLTLTLSAGDVKVVARPRA